MTHLNLSGYPGAGKTTIFGLFQAQFPNLVVIPKITTRPRRSEEGDLEYIFSSNEEFESKRALGQIVGIEEICQKGIPYFYGIPTRELWPTIPENTEIVLSLFGEHAPDVRDKFFPEMKLIFLSLSNKTILLDRLAERCKIDGSDFNSRKLLVESYLASNFEQKYDVVVYNDTTPEECLGQIFSFL